MTNKQENKDRNRAKAKQHLLDRLGAMGGLLTTAGAADKTGVTEDKILRMIDENEIIVILNQSGDTLVPGFQITKGTFLPHFSELMERLNNASNEAKCSFFLNPISNHQGQAITPWEILSHDLSKEDIDILKREARLFLSNSAS